jgi:D-glycero-beta-D-manno-heptose-7-phosphate kinase
MALLTSAGEHVRVPTVARSVYDVSGAGDTVTAVLAVALAAGATVVEAAVLANHAAGIEVGKAGVATVSPEELLAMLGFIEGVTST